AAIPTDTQRPGPAARPGSLRRSMARVAVVSGANRGIGLEVAYGLAARGTTTVLGSRDARRGEEAAVALAGRGVDVLPWQLDVTNGKSVAALAGRIELELGAVHVLVNNAAIHYDTWQ